MLARRLVLLLVVLAPSARADDKLPDGAVRRMVVTEDGEGTLFCVAFSPDGKTIAVGGSLRRVHLFDVQTGELLRSFGNHPDNVWTVAWSPDGKMLCSGGRADLTLRVWDPASGDELKPFEGHKGGITRIKFFGDGKRLIMSGGSWDPTIRVWDVERRQQLMAMPGHTNLIDAMDLAAHGRLAVSGSRDGTLRLWDLTRGREIWRDVEPEEVRNANSDYAFRAGAVAFSPDARMFVAGGHEGIVDVRETVTRRRCLRRSEGNGPISAVAFSPDGQLIAFATRQRQVVLCSARTGAELRCFRDQVDISRSEIYGLAFSPDGTTLATCTSAGTIILWRVPPIAAEKKALLTESSRNDHVDALASENPIIARYAIRALVNDTGPTVAALAKRIKPAEAGDQMAYERWIADLASARFADREQASTELDRAGERAEALLQLALARSTDTEQRRRVDRLLDKLARRVPADDELAHLRAVQVLELRGDADSRVQLRRLAAGAPSRLTTEAREAVERLK